MIDYQALIQIFSVPRPNGSKAERTTRQAVLSWLEHHHIPYRCETFRIFPYLFEGIGIWLLVSRTLLAVAIWCRWGWWTTWISLIGLLGGTLDEFLNLPMVSWIGAGRDENVLVEFSPPQPRREAVVCAHYDSKTELLDHRQRMILLKMIPAGLAISLLLGILGPLDAWVRHTQPGLEITIYWTSAALTIPLLILAWGMGLNLALGRLLHPSRGSVDDGAACTLLLSLADALFNRKNPFDLKSTRVTLALFTGEEVDRQGSRAYAHSRTWPIPAICLNLEAMAQDGDYVYWQQDGSLLHLSPTDATVNRLLCQAVNEVSGHLTIEAGPMLSDGASFLQIGIPTAVLGTYDRRFKDRGMHHPSDNPGRVDFRRLPEGVRILARFLQLYDQSDQPS
jgi:hypothetical protein